MVSRAESVQNEKRGYVQVLEPRGERSVMASRARSLDLARGVFWCGVWGDVCPGLVAVSKAGDQSCLGPVLWVPRRWPFSSSVA